MGLLVQTTPLLLDLGILILRLFIGICLVIHALGKLGLVGPGNMAGFAGWLKSLGVPFPEIQARLAMSAELIGGICIALGFFARPAIVPAFFTLVVAATLGHKGAGYLITNNPPGNEYAMNLAAILFVLFLLGPGRFSVDSYIWAAGL